MEGIQSTQVQSNNTSVDEVEVVNKPFIMNKKYVADAAANSVIVKVNPG